MDPSTIIGIGLASVAIVGSLIMDGGNIGSMLLHPADDAGVRRHDRRGRRRRHDAAT